MNLLRTVAILMLLVMAFQTDALAQSNRHEVTGIITDTEDNTLASATVVLLSAADSTIISYGITRADGLFRLRRVPAGAYQLQVTFVGFEPDRRAIEVTDSDLELGRIPLAVSTNELDELVVTDEHIPMVIKRDTLEYNAAAFNVRANANVEELLRRLPGVDVERDGTIRAQGEEVEQVLVDGKEFFGNDPRIATQNLPADAVDKVQVYDKKSDMAEFSGVDDGEESKTINLALKEESKQGYFGNTSGGFGNDEATSRYEGKASINRFSPRTQLSFIGNLNNINQQGFSFGDMMNFMGGLQSMVSGNFSRGDMPLNTSVSDGFTVTTAAGINFNHDFSAKTSLQSSYFYNAVDNEQDRLVNQQQLIGSTASSNSLQTSLQNMLTQNHRLNLNLQHKFGEGHDIRIRSNLQASQSDLDNRSNRNLSDILQQPVSNNATLYNSDGTDYGGTASLTYRKKLSSRGRTLVAEARGRLNSGDMNGNLEALNSFFDNAGNVMSSEELFQLQSQLNTTQSNRMKLSWTEPLKNRRSLELHAERRQSTQEQDKEIFDRLNGTNVLNTNLSAALDQTYTYYRGGFNFRINKEYTSFSLGADLQEAQLDGDILDQDIRITNSSTRVLPMASFRHEFSGSTSLELRYRASTREPSMRELQPFSDNSDPINVYTGNPNLKPEYSHSGTLHFMLFDQFSFTNLFGYLQASYTTDKIATARTIDDQFRQNITSVNVDGDWLVTGSMNFGTPIRALGTKINLATQTMYNRGFTFINDAENRSRLLRQTVDLRLENRSKDIIDALIGARLTFNVTKYSLNPDLNANYINRTYYAELTYSLGDHWRFTSGFDYRVFADEVFGDGQQIPIWRAEISRSLMNNKAEIQLVGLDLLNRNVSVNYSNTGNFIQEQRINSLGRYFMLKFVYNLSGIGNRGGITFMGN